MPFSKDFVPVPDSELPRVHQARVIRPNVNLNEIAEVTLYVRSDPSSESLGSLVDDMGNLRVSERRYLSRSEFAQGHAADPGDLDAVERFAAQNGLAISATNPTRRTVRVTGRLGNLAKAFNVQLQTHQSSRGTYRSYAGPVSVPAELSDIVQGVFGLDTTPQSQYHLRTKQQQRPAPFGYAAPNASPAAASSTFYPPELAQLYNFPTGIDGQVDGQGQCVGIVEFGGGYTMNDLNTYFQDLGITTPPNIVAVSVGGATNSPSTPNSADMEVILDIEVVASIVPGALIVVYFAPNTTMGWLRGISSAIHDSFHNPSVISISWGGPEQTWTRSALRAMNYEFKTAAALGITICAAAGDNGYTDGVPGMNANVDFPASSPYVLACGGSSVKSADGSITDETVWNDAPNNPNPSNAGATGGGISAFFPLPSYQGDADVPPSVNPPNNPGRGVPDVAGDADPNTGYRIRVDGTNQVVGGTSAVAPLWAALLALINQKLGTPVGFVNPLLYSQGLSGGGFNDIVSGTNGKYAAGSGWDPCTGLGSPDGTALSEVL
jgi:kumamolisin